MTIFNLLANLYANKKFKQIINSNLFYLVSLGILGLSPLFWFYKDFIIRPEELSYINYSFLFEKYIYAWSTHTSNGLPTTYSNQLILFPVGLIYAFLEKIQLTEQHIQKTVLIFFFELILLSSYALFVKLSNNNKSSFLASIFYSFNFYTLSIPFYTAKMIQMAIFPIIFQTTLNYLETKKIKYIFINYITLFIFQGVFSNIANAATTMVAYIIAIFYYVYTAKPKVNLTKNIGFLTTYFLAIIPIFINIGLIFYYSVLNTDLYIKLRETNAFAHTFLSTSISKIFTIFHGAWWENSEVYNTLFDHFNNPLIIISSIGLFAFLILGFLTIDKHEKNWRFYVFWFFTFCIFIFFVKGINQPFGAIYKLMFFNVPGFFVFREPWAKFTPLIVFSGSIVFLYVFESISKYKYLPKLIFIMILLIALPFLTGNAINHTGSGYSDTDILIPDYWKDFHEWSKSKENQNLNIFGTPVIYGTQEYYNWQGYEKGNLTGSFVYTYLYSNSINRLDDPTGIHYEYLKTYSPNLFSIFNVDYILNQGDVVDIGANKNYSIENLSNKNIVEKEPFLTFGRLTLYKLQPKYILPRVYIPQNIHEYRSNDDKVLPTILNIFPEETSPAYISLRGKESSYDNLSNSAITVGSKVNSNIQTLDQWDSGWPWPIEVRISPKSTKYKLVRFSEYIKQKTTQNQLDKVDLDLWFAGKRIEEIQEFDLNSLEKKDLLEDFTQKIAYISKTLRNLPESERNEEYWGIVKKSHMYIKRFIQTGAIDKTVYLEKNLNELDSFQSWINEKVNSYCKKQCYEIKAAETGTYQVYIKNSELRKIWPKIEELNNYSDGTISVTVKTKEFNSVSPQTMKIAPLYVEDINTPVKIGQIDLIKDEIYYIDLSFLDTTNVVDNGLWNTPDIGKQSDFEIEFTPQSVISEYTTKEGEELRIENNMIKFKELPRWEPDTQYKLSFKYKIDNGRLGVLVSENLFDISAIAEGRIGSNFEKIDHSSLIHKTALKELMREKCSYDLNNENCWMKYEKVIHSNSLSADASIYFYATPDSNNFSKVLVKEIKIEPVTDLKPILIFNKNTDISITKPNIKYKMINPTKYSLEIQNAMSPYVIVFSQTFHKGWKLYINNQEVGKMRHEIANGYANAWQINPNEVENQNNYTLTLEYYPQKILYYTWGITILIFIFSIIYLLFEILFNKNYNLAESRQIDLYSQKPQLIRLLRIKMVNKLKKPLLTLGILTILLYELSSFSTISDFVTFVIIILAIIVIKLARINSKNLIYTSLSLITIMAIFRLFENYTFTEIFATFALTLIIVTSYIELTRKSKNE